MRLNDAVYAVTGEVFRDGWSRVRGSMQGLHVAKQTQLMRAAAGHRPAVFKAIRGGGTHTKSQLANQLDYLTTKSTHIVNFERVSGWEGEARGGRDQGPHRALCQAVGCGVQAEAWPDHPYAHVLPSRYAG